MKNNIKKKIKENKGFTLVEALIAIIILAVVSVLMVQGVSMARKAYSSNKMKTEASAIANQEIENIRAMPYSDVGTTGGDPLGVLVNYTTSSGYLVEYNVSWTEEPAVEIKRTKQVKVSVSKDPVQNIIEVITEITPLGEILASENSTVNAPKGGIIITKVAVGGLTGTFNFVVKNSGGTVSSPSITISSGETNKSAAPITGLTPGTYTVTEISTGAFSTVSVPSSGSVPVVAGQNTVITFTNTPTLQYPKPSDLKVISDYLQGNNRKVTLQWQRPNTTLTIIKYNIYRNNLLLINTITSDLQTVEYLDTNFNNWDSNPYTYFIKAVYLGNILGQSSNEVVTSPN